ncbi:jg4075 [Pararge aegeria aegeria]|uniref:Jg4075 protein n=1 Tax=Pararge aegeria aegeria TaxID=348720 RepID=A0A8S4RUW8_9NEOP|nr:jg4075 [Pararge aegeria aegeria]
MQTRVILTVPTEELHKLKRLQNVCIRTLADNHLRGCYGVTGGVGRARKLAMRRAPGLDDIGGEVGDVDPRVPPARTRTSARFDVNLTVGGLLD